MRLHVFTWVRIVGNLSPLPNSPERRLVGEVVAQAISAECSRADRVAESLLFVDPFWRQNFRAYCGVLQINPDQLLGMARDAILACSERFAVRGQSMSLSTQALAGLSSTELRAIRSEVRSRAVARAPQLPA